MANNYEFVSSREIAVQVSPEEVRDLQRVYLRALPSGVVFSVDVKLGLDLAQVASVAGGELAPVFNAWYATPGVTGISIADDIDASDTLRNYLTVTVDSDSGNASTSRTVPLAGLTTDAFRALVADIRSDLNALEAI